MTDATPDRVQCLCPVCGADDWENVSLWDEEGVEGRRCDTCENTWDDNWDDCPEGDPLWTTLEQAKAALAARQHHAGKPTANEWRGGFK